MAKKSPSRVARRQAAREAARRDGKEINLAAIRQGRVVRVAGAKRKSTT